MATYLELKEKADRLLEQAEELRQQEIFEVIADIKEKMETYGLTIEDLGLVKPKTKNIKSTAPAKYRGPNGQLWVGGRGRKPDWILAAIKAGKDIDKEFGI